MLNVGDDEGELCTEGELTTGAVVGGVVIVAVGTNVVTEGDGADVMAAVGTAVDS